MHQGNAEADSLKADVLRLEKELKEVHEELDRSNQELMLLTLELDERVEARTAQLRRLQDELTEHRDKLQEMVYAQSREIAEANVQLQARLDELQASECRFQAVLDGFNEMVYVSDPVTRELLYTNTVTADQLLGAVGQKCHQVMFGLDAPCDFCPDIDLSPSGETLVWERWDEAQGRWFRRLDKSMAWPDGRIVHFVLSLDITDIKEAEDVLLRSTVSRELVGEIIHSLKAKWGLGGGRLFNLGRDMAAGLKGLDMADYIEQFSHMGFGDLELVRRHEDLKRWIFTGMGLVEVRPGGRYPTDHFTLGYLCGAVKKISKAQKVLGEEFECRSMGDPVCRFIIQER